MSFGWGSGGGTSLQVLKNSGFLYQVPSMAALLAVTGWVDGLTVEVESFWPSLGKGGGTFTWLSSQPKNTHNGGTIIDPGRVLPADFEVANQAATRDWFISSATGTGCWLRLHVSEYLATWYGAKGNGTADDSFPVQRWLWDITRISAKGRAPNGTYLKGFCLDDSAWTLSSGGARWLDFSYPSGASISIEGDGKKSTTFKVANNYISTIGRFAFTFGWTTAYSVNSPLFVHMGKLSIDQNGSNNPLGGGDPPYEFEQAHCINVAPHTRSVFEDIHIKDKVGGGIVFTGGSAESVVFEGVTSSDWSGAFGERSEIESQGRAEHLSVDRCYVRNIQIETDAGGSAQEIRLSNSKAKTIDLAGGANRENFAAFIVNSESTEQTYLSQGTFIISNCRLHEGENAFKWSQWNVGSRISNSEIVLAVDGSNNVSFVRPRLAGSTDPAEFVFDNVYFRIDSTDLAFVPNNAGFAISGAQEVNTIGKNWCVILQNCHFDKRLKGVADNYRSFFLIVKNSDLACSGAASTDAAFKTGALTVTNEATGVELINNRYDRMTAANLFRVEAVDTTNNLELRVNGEMPEAKWRFSWGAAGAATIRPRIEAATGHRVMAELVGDTLPPATHGLRGARVRRLTPTAAEWYEQVSTTLDTWAVVSTLP